jgi:pimeloyl-ACP methyl ester carboxylesterase
MGRRGGCGRGGSLVTLPPVSSSASSRVGFVFVHGGGASAGFWDRLVAALDRPTLAVDLPGRGDKPADPMTLTVDACVDSVVADVAEADLGDIVLVAHSSGGLFVPGTAAALAPRVRHIVLSAASVPPEGGTGLDCMKPSHQERMIGAIEAARRDGWTLTTPGPPEDPETMRASYGDTLDDATLAFVVDPARAVKDSMNFYFQPISWASIATIPVTYVKNLRDRPVPAALQDAMVGRLPNPVEVVDLDVGHIPAITNVTEFAAILESVAEKYDGAA